MPPKARITREMIVEEGFQIARAEGPDKITARSVSQRLGCSTQPVLYSFHSVEEIRAAVYQRADAYHSQWLMRGERDYGDPMLNIGMNYIRFAVEEPRLFRFLFQSDSFAGAGLTDLMGMEALEPMIGLLAQEAGVTQAAAREIFMTLFVLAHGYASLFANNSMVYDETQIVSALSSVFTGAICAAKGAPK